MSSVDTVILQHFLRAQGEYISGRELGETLKISRVSIWGHLDKFKKSGFRFEATRNRGYRLLEMPKTVHPDLFQAYLNVSNVPIHFVYFKTVDSTNTEVERQLSKGAHLPLLIVSSKMTEGRGRRGRRWEAQDLGNLYMSFGFSMNIPAHKMGLFTLWVAVSVCDYLHEGLGVEAQVKWPNDLVSRGRKFCGMLTEARIDSEYVRDVVLGIGTNVNTQLQKIPEPLHPYVTSLKEITGRAFNLNEVGVGLTEVILKAFEAFVSGDIKDDFVRLWDRYDALKGKSVRVERHGDTLEGVVLGVDENGRLMLLQSDQTHYLEAGDVSLQTKALKASV